MLIIDQYMRQKSLEISEDIKDLKRIYLDLNFWLRLRDEAAMEPSARMGMLALANELVEQNKCLFPVSDIIYYEVLKQHDERSRRETLLIINKLSRGVSLVDDRTRIKVEYLHWMEAALKRSFPEAKTLVWGSLPIITGYKGLAAMDFKEQPSEIQFQFFDFLSKMPITEITPDVMLAKKPFMFKDDVAEFNKNKKLYEDQNITFEQLLLSEVGGMLEAAGYLFRAASQEKYFRNTGLIPTQEEVDQMNVNEFGGLIYQVFKLKKIGTFMPFFRIGSAIFASFRWNKNRIYRDGNDTLDVMHAAGALPYCDYFFTERELKTIIEQQKLDKLYDCRVASKPAQVMEILDTLR
jgi:hypothetical protein